MKKNEFHGCFYASYKAEREEFGAFPKKDGVIDTSLKVLDSSYSLYVKVDNEKIKVTGENTITGLESSDKIAAPLGYSIGADLKEKGYSVMEAHSGEGAFKMLLKDRVQAVTDITLNGDSLLVSPEFKGKIKEISPPIVEKPYYLMLSQHFVAKNPNLAQKIWEMSAKIKNDPDFKKEFSEWLNKTSTSE